MTACSGALGYNGVEIAGGFVTVAATHVHDGRIRGFSNGGVLADFYAGAGTVLERLVVTDNDYIGIMAQGTTAATHIRVSDCVVARNHSSGISTVNGNYRLAVERCVVSENGDKGIVGGDGSTFTENRVNGNARHGLACNPVATAICAVGGNTLYANNGGGANAQWQIATARVLGSNVCMDDGTCP